MFAFPLPSFSLSFLVSLSFFIYLFIYLLTYSSDVFLSFAVILLFLFSFCYLYLPLFICLLNRYLTIYRVPFPHLHQALVFHFPSYIISYLYLKVMKLSKYNFHHLLRSDKMMRKRRRRRKGEMMVRIYVHI